MRKAVVAVLLALPCSVFAQAPSTCSPVSSPKHTYGALGQHTVVVCTDTYGTVAYPLGFSCRHDVCNLGAFGEAMMRVTTAPDYRKALDAEWALSIKWTCDMPPDTSSAALCTERANWIASNWSSWTLAFKPAVWRVKANGTSLTRPAYALSGGILGTREAGRATVGSLCDLSKPLLPATNGDVRAEYGVNGLVTICKRS